MNSASSLACNVGVSCDICKKSSFSGLRYKCLACYDYDLCAQCYDDKQVSNTHSLAHPVQCIVPRGDYEVYYAGEPVIDYQTKSYTCPLCGLMGFTKTTLSEHVLSEHPQAENSESSIGIVCPICCAERSQYIFDFPTHMVMEHKTSREITNDQFTIRGSRGRCVRTIPRRRANYTSAGGASSNSTSNRESAEHLVEILAHLSGVRRSIGLAQSATQLQQLQMHLQSSPSFSRPATTTTTTSATRTESLMEPPIAPLKQQSCEELTPSHQLLSKCSKPIITEKESQKRDILRADRSLFAQELLLQIGSTQSLKLD